MIVKKTKKEKAAEYYLANKEKIKQKSLLYYENNKEQCIERNRSYRKENSEKIYLTQKIWANENKEKLNKSRKIYYEKNHEKWLIYGQNHRISKIKRVPSWLSDDDKWMIQEIYHLAKLRTSLTGVKWEVDHIIPLQGKNVSGLHVPTNLRVITQRENRSKWNLFNI